MGGFIGYEVLLWIYRIGGLRGPHWAWGVFVDPPLWGAPGKLSQCIRKSPTLHIHERYVNVRFAQPSDRRYGSEQWPSPNPLLSSMYNNELITGHRWRGVTQPHNVRPKPLSNKFGNIRNVLLALRHPCQHRGRHVSHTSEP